MPLETPISTPISHYIPLETPISTPSFSLHTLGNTYFHSQFLVTYLWKHLFQLPVSHYIPLETPISTSSFSLHTLGNTYFHFQFLVTYPWKHLFPLPVSRVLDFSNCGVWSYYTFVHLQESDLIAHLCIPLLISWTIQTTNLMPNTLYTELLGNTACATNLRTATLPLTLHTTEIVIHEFFCSIFWIK